MAACLASVVASGGDGLAGDHASWEIAATSSAACVIFADWILAALSRALNALSRCLLWWMLGENADCHLCVSLTFFCCSHSFKLDKGSWAFLIALNMKQKILYYSKLLKQPAYRSYEHPYPIHTQSISGLFSAQIWTVQHTVASGRGYRNAMPQRLSKDCSRSFQTTYWCHW